MSLNLKYIGIGVGVLVVALGGYAVWQHIETSSSTAAKNSEKIAALSAEIKTLQRDQTIENKAIADWHARNQKIGDVEASILAKIETAKPSGCKISPTLANLGVAIRKAQENTK